MKDQDFLLTFIVPFDHTLFVSKDIVGIKRNIKIHDIDAFIEFPGEPKNDETQLSPPISCPENVSKHLPENGWGLKKEGHKEVYIDALLFGIPAKGKLPELKKNQIGGLEIKKLNQKVICWSDSLTHWLWVLTSQSLDPVYPDPKFIHRKSRNVIANAQSTSETSIPVIMSPSLKIIISRDGQSAERIVNKDVLETAISSVDTAPSLALELLSSSRMAARRADHRKALIDSGTAVELALSQILNIRNKTLGGLVREAFNKRIDIPADTKAAFVDLRNDAAHRGKVNTKGTDRALEIAEEIIALSEPTLITFSTLEPVLRPQRFDLVIIQKNT